MGGAIATIAAIDYQSVYGSPESISIVTLGQPRIGNKEFALWAASINFKFTRRIVNYNDLVPHLPWRVLGFQHIPIPEVWIDKGNLTHYCSGGNDTESGNCANSVKFYSTKRHGHAWDLSMSRKACFE